MSERLSDINSMFNVPRNTVGEITMQHVRGRLEQGGDSDNLRPFRSIGGLAGDLVARPSASRGQRNERYRTQ